MKKDIKVSDTCKSRLSLKADTIYQHIQNSTPEEIKTWINSNVNSIADVRKVLTLLILNMKAKL